MPLVRLNHVLIVLSIKKSESGPCLLRESSSSLTFSITSSMYKSKLLGLKKKLVSAPHEDIDEFAFLCHIGVDPDLYLFRNSILSDLKARERSLFLALFQRPLINNGIIVQKTKKVIFFSCSF